MHNGSERAVSIKLACEEAEEGHLKPYLVLTDSILGVIRCCPVCITKNPAEKDAIDKVIIRHSDAYQNY